LHGALNNRTDAFLPRCSRERRLAQAKGGANFYSAAQAAIGAKLPHLLADIESVQIGADDFACDYK